jgi:hypothetical protein
LIGYVDILMVELDIDSVLLVDLEGRRRLLVGIGVYLGLDGG